MVVHDRQCTRVAGGIVDDGVERPVEVGTAWPAFRDRWRSQCTEPVAAAQRSGWLGQGVSQGQDSKHVQCTRASDIPLQAREGRQVEDLQNLIAPRTFGQSMPDVDDKDRFKRLHTQLQAHAGRQAPSIEGINNVIAEVNSMGPPLTSKSSADYVDLSILDALKKEGFFEEMKKRYGI
jgi:hypothetical protein